MNKNIALAVSLLCLMGLASADEGMWTVDNFPSGRVADEYGVEIDDDWLRAAQLATTRLENGCTGSFASPDGLVLTNNHCIWGCIRNLSSAERNLSDEGFLAASREQELRCPGQQVSVLIDLEDVTGVVAEATQGLDDAEANEARKAALTDLETECEQAADDDGVQSLVRPRPVPAAPTDPADALANGWTLATTLAPGATAYDDEPADRLGEQTGHVSNASSYRKPSAASLSTRGVLTNSVP